MIGLADSQVWSANSVFSCTESVREVHNVGLPCDFLMQSGSWNYLIKVGIILLMCSWKVLIVLDFHHFCFWKCSIGVGMYVLTQALNFEKHPPTDCWVFRRTEEFLITDQVFELIFVGSVCLEAIMDHVSIFRFETRTDCKWNQIVIRWGSMGLNECISPFWFNSVSVTVFLQVCIRREDSWKFMCAAHAEIIHCHYFMKVSLTFMI